MATPHRKRCSVTVWRHYLCSSRVADHGDELWITPGAELSIGAVTVTTLWAACCTDSPGIRWQADPHRRRAASRNGSGAAALPCRPSADRTGARRVSGTLTTARPQCRRRQPRRGHRRWCRLLHREWRSTLDIQAPGMSVNASPTPSRTSTHDSGPPWFARPST